MRERPKRLFVRLAREERGVAAVEFALILPLLILLYFGTVEAASLFTVDRRVATVASTMADLVSREKKSISQGSTLANYFQAANGIMQPYPTTSLKQVVTLLKITSAGVTTVVWSVGYNGGVARTATASYNLPASSQINQLARTNGYLVMSEISYPYKPLFGMVISNTVNLSRTEYFLPRYEDKIDLVS
ncbi:MAG: pilus assembly protein [Devosia sp.]|nr:pilus assembly protein [Devosia sp.]